MDNYTDRIADAVIASKEREVVARIAALAGLRSSHPGDRWRRETAALNALAAVCAHTRAVELQMSPADYLATAYTVARRLTDALTPTNSGETE